MAKKKSISVELMGFPPPVSLETAQIQDFDRETADYLLARVHPDGGFIDVITCATADDIRKFFAKPDGGKGEAVYQVRPRNGEEWTDVSEAEYKICGGAGYVQRILYTAPTPERADTAPLQEEIKRLQDEVRFYRSEHRTLANMLKERADAEKDAALTNEQIEAAIKAWFDTDGKDVDDHQSRMRAAILAASKEK